MAAGKKFRKRGVDIDTAWDAMDRYKRFKLLDASGSQILPVLVALRPSPQWWCTSTAVA